jgi:hypothetical protein
MASKEDSHVAESRASPSLPSYPRYTAFLLTALVVALLGILITHGIMVSKMADAPNIIDNSLSSLHFDLHSINGQLSAVVSQISTVGFDIREIGTITVTPAGFATFTT